MTILFWSGRILPLGLADRPQSGILTRGSVRISADRN